MSAPRIAPGVRVTTAPLAGLESNRHGRVMRRVCCMYYNGGQRHHCAGHSRSPVYLVREDATGREFTMPRSYLRTHHEAAKRAREGAA